MSTTVFNISVKTVECQNCGAPVNAMVSGGVVTCEYCGAQLSITHRVRDRAHDQHGSVDESARQAQLWAQVKTYNPKRSRLSAALPPELAPLFLKTEDLEQREAMMVEIRRHWDAIRQRVHGGDSGDDAIERLYVIGLNLAGVYSLGGDHLRARATLETLLDLVPTVEHRDIVRLGLARAALRIDDDVAAEHWVAECDHASHDLDVHTHFLMTRAAIAVHRRDYLEALRCLGDSDGDVPLALKPQTYCYRAHAYAGLNREDKARGQIAKVLRKFAHATVSVTFKINDGPATKLVPTWVKSPKKRKRAGIMALLGSALPIALFASCFVTPSCPMITASEPMSQALAAANRCPDAVRVLGRNITWGFGCSGGKGSGGCGGCSGNWHFGVKGDRSRGSMRMGFSISNGEVNSLTAVIRADGRSINVTRCSGWQSGGGRFKTPSKRRKTTPRRPRHDDDDDHTLPAM